MACSECVIGYDAREMWYLRDTPAASPIRADCQKILTVDSSIWGCVFDDGQYPDISGASRLQIGLGDIPLPEYTGLNTPFWDDLAGLKEYLVNHDAQLKHPYWIIAITFPGCRHSDPTSLDEWPRIEPAKPATLDKQWTCLGYDVTNNISESSILQTSTSADKHTKAQPHRWADLLNRWNLFSAEPGACQFKADQDAMHPEDSPHRIYGLWLVNEVDD